MTELEKVTHLTTKYKGSERVYTVYKRDHTYRGYECILIYGSDDKQKVKKYTDEKEKEGENLIVYCAHPQKKVSSCVHRTED